MGDIANTGLPEIIEARKTLLKAKSLGITLKALDNGKISVNGPAELMGSELDAKLRKHKNVIFALMSNPSPGIANTIDRLQKGQKLLIKMQDHLYDQPPSARTTERKTELFWDSIVRWDLLDMLLRGYGEHDDSCPIGPEGCHPESPVVCRTCAHQAIEEGKHELNNRS